jgi:hypothetical protein
MLGPMADSTKEEHEENAAGVDEEREETAAEDLAEKDEESTPEGERPGSEPTRHSAGSSGSAFRWIAAAALVVALGALGTSLWQLLRPAPKPAAAAGPTEQQIADARSKACSAYNTVRAAVTVRSNTDPGPDPNGAQAEAVAANARLALAVGHSYLMSNLDPATPGQIADAIRKFANDSEGIAINALAGVSNDDPAQAARLKNAVELDGQITELCK